ncbi:MAG TPA: flagellar basal body rod protein FlgB [Spirochaetia bacterium]|nr:flagellar basal body rod protein FlgB [Spirochaetia bacterium]
MSLFDSNVIQALTDTLNAASVRQQVIANNIANAETPGFKRSDTRFSDMLAQALGQPAGKIPLSQDNTRDMGGAPSLQDLAPQVVTDYTTAGQLNGNNVDMDVEQSNMATNTLLYDTAAQELSDRLSLESYVITTNQ